MRLSLDIRRIHRYSDCIDPSGYRCHLVRMFCDQIIDQLLEVLRSKFDEGT